MKVEKRGIRVYSVNNKRIRVDTATARQLSERRACCVFIVSGLLPFDWSVLAGNTHMTLMISTHAQNTARCSYLINVYLHR